MILNRYGDLHFTDLVTANQLSVSGVLLKGNF